MDKQKLLELVDQSTTRRNLLKGMGVGGAALLGGSLLAGCGGSGVNGIGTNDNLTDIEILQLRSTSNTSRRSSTPMRQPVAALPRKA